MLILDHLAVACTDLAQGTAWVEDRLGVSLSKGGKHARYGTHNTLLGLAEGIYLEVIAPDPDAVPEAGHRWFGLDHFSGPPRLANWICRTESLDQVPDIAGPARALARGDLHWRITVPDDGALPPWRRISDPDHMGEGHGASGGGLASQRLPPCGIRGDPSTGGRDRKDDRPLRRPRPSWHRPFRDEGHLRDPAGDTPSMTIRPAIADDAAQIAAIWNHAIQHTTITFNPVTKSDAEVADLCARQALVWEEDGRILGFARFFQFRGGAGYRHTAEHTILLHPDGQGRGMGRALMAATCAAAEAEGYHSLFAGCSGENPGAVAFHTACGFQTVATLPEVGFKFGRWIDLVLMQKML